MAVPAQAVLRKRAKAALAAEQPARASANGADGHLQVRDPPSNLLPKTH
jgi:hypothetical protein